MEIFEKIREKRQNSCYRKMKTTCLCEGKKVPSPFEWDRRRGIMVYQDLCLDCNHKQKGLY